jgi:hypothetical protein
MIPSTLDRHTSPAQCERLDKLEELHPATRFEVVYWCRWSCALEIEWSDLEGEGDFIIAPNGRILPQRCDG